MKLAMVCTLFFSLFIGCVKHNDKPADPVNPPDPTPPKLTRIKSLNTNTFSYDSLGRLVRSSYGNSITARTDYTYTQTTVTGKDFDLQGNLYGGGVVYTLGANGLATSEKYIIDSTAPPFVLTFTYNAKRQLIEQLFVIEGEQEGTRSVFYYSKDNMDSAKLYSSLTNSWLGTEKYEYYTDQPDLLKNESNGITYVGVGNANLLKKATRTNTGATTVIEYTYEYDAQKRPVKVHEIVDGNPGSDTIYTYY